MKSLYLQYFGLSSLHQLRGRIGTEGEEARCFLVLPNLPHEAQERLKRFVQVSDGFSISKVDMQRRGAGNILGKLQSGHFGYETTSHLYNETRACASSLLYSDLERMYPLCKARLKIND